MTQRQIIERNYVQLLEEINTDYVLPYLVQEGALTLDMVSDIKNTGNKTKTDKNQRLLELLLCGGDDAFRALVKSLKVGSKQNHLVNVLSGTVESQRPVQCTDHDVTDSEICHRAGILKDIVPDDKLVFIAKIISTDFYQVGLVLGVPLNKMDAVSADHYGNSERQAIAMLTAWRMLNNRSATWEVLINCLKCLELNLKADEVFHSMTSSQPWLS